MMKGKVGGQESDGAKEGGEDGGVHGWMVCFVGEIVCIKLIRDPRGLLLANRDGVSGGKRRGYTWVARPIEKCASKQVHPYSTIVKGQGARTTGPRSKKKNKADQKRQRVKDGRGMCPHQTSSRRNTKKTRTNEHKEKKRMKV